MAVGQRTKALQISRLWFNHADILEHWLGDKRRDGTFLHHALDCCKVIERHGVRENLFLRRNAGRDRHAGILIAVHRETAELFARAQEVRRDGIVMAVVAALHFDEVRPAGPGPSHANRLGGGFGAGIEKLNFFHVGHRLEEESRELSFLRGRA